MNSLIQYTIPVLGLHEGIHQFQFMVGADFFSAFEDSLIREGTIVVGLTFEKRSNLCTMVFDLEGTVLTECDRCLEPFDLPIQDQQQLTVKYAEEERDEAEVIYIKRGERQLNVARFIYEFIHLALPIITTHDEVSGTCNEEMLEYLENSPEIEPESEPNPVWQALRNFGSN